VAPSGELRGKGMCGVFAGYILRPSNAAVVNRSMFECPGATQPASGCLLKYELPCVVLCRRRFLF